MRKPWRSALAALGLGLQIACAATGHADPSSMDRQFLDLMNRDGIDADNGLTTLISMAHGICQERMSGTSESALSQYIYQKSQLSTLAKATALVQDSEQVYCPGYLGAASAPPAGTTT